MAIASSKQFAIIMLSVFLTFSFVFSANATPEMSLKMTHLSDYENCEDCNVSTDGGFVNCESDCLVPLQGLILNITKNTLLVGTTKVMKSDLLLVGLGFMPEISPPRISN